MRCFFFRHAELKSDPSMIRDLRMRRLPSFFMSISIAGTFIFSGASAAASEGSQSDLTVKHHYFGRTLTWTITNHRNHPCVRIEIPSAVAYDHVVPDGWEFDAQFSGLRAWTDEPAFSIFPGQSKEFRITAGGNGTKPGYVEATMELTDGSRVDVESVATFERESTLTRAMPPLTMMVFAALVVLVWRKSAAAPLHA